MLREAQKRWPTFSSVWLIGINFLYFLVGILLIGLCSWGISTQEEDPVTAALPAGGMITLVFVGSCLILISVVGWVGVKFNYNACGRATLGVYATVLIILMIMEFSAAGVIITFSERLNEFSAAQAVRDYGVFYLINQSYADCCCAYVRCPNDTCWLPARLLYPCDSLDHFKTYLVEYIDDRLIPIGVIAILIGFVQLFTAITACCSQCSGKHLQSEDKARIGGPTTYDGLYADGEDYSGGYGFDSYTKPAPGNAARPAGVAGATAPRPGAGRPAGAVAAAKTTTPSRAAPTGGRTTAPTATAAAKK